MTSEDLSSSSLLITSMPLSTTMKRDDDASANGNWVVNSNLLSLGFNPIRGDPVCYTGNCRLNGFGNEIFKFQYTKVPIGSCTTKLIPEYVTVNSIDHFF